MQLLQSFVFALLFSCEARSAPTPTTTRSQLQGRSFKIERVRQGASVLDGATALQRSYRKYGIAAVDLGIDDLLDIKPLSSGNSQTNTDDDQTGEVSAVSVQGDAQFVSPVTIGGQTIVMNFDTGSADFWVMNTQLPSDQTKGHTIYDPSKSSTYKEMKDYTFNITYGDSSYAYGGVGQDTVDIGGATATGQAVGLPTEVSSYFVGDTCSNGLVGLGFSVLNMVQPEPQKTFFDNVADNLDEPLFTALLKSDGQGEYEFGTIDPNKYSGQLINVTVDPSAGFWQFDSKFFSVGNGPLEQVSTAPTSIVDSGTSLMLMSPEVAAAYYAQVDRAVYANSAGGWIYPCSSELPNFSVAVGNSYMATVPGSLINFAGVGQNSTTGEDLCYGGIQSNQDTSLQILGDVFMKSMFVVFDKRGPSISFASPVWE
ncbi:pepsin-like aspartic protease [Aspergillus chevalieri]|uniref:Peptidase A1 domain-containing protein n=1 Tax=Aspergillus chevalieri TaxID=182096 RepID=A0A7R7VTH4_ASPCH|nr:uncharacterized protein ACHE_60408S [Aspergillus chevalieri]BCR90522.1 hypothetical protein ACHE_60408S [Aspergillus chevalieri]